MGGTNCARRGRLMVRDTKVDADAIHRQNGLNLSVGVHKAGALLWGSLAIGRTQRVPPAFAPYSGGSQPPRRLPAQCRSFFVPQFRQAAPGAPVARCKALFSRGLSRRFPSHDFCRCPVVGKTSGIRLPACPTSRQRFHSYVVHPIRSISIIAVNSPPELPCPEHDRHSFGAELYRAYVSSYRMTKRRPRAFRISGKSKSRRTPGTTASTRSPSGYIFIRTKAI